MASLGMACVSTRAIATARPARVSANSRVLSRPGALSIRKLAQHNVWGSERGLQQMRLRAAEDSPAPSDDEPKGGESEEDIVDDKYSLEPGMEINLEKAGEFMIKGDTEFLDKVADNSAVRETLIQLEACGKAEREVLGQAWDLLVQLGVPRPEEGPGSDEYVEEMKLKSEEEEKKKK